MKRKYGYIKEHEKEMLEMKAKGISIRKIGECFGLTYEQTHDFFKRHNRKQRRIENGEGIKKKGRPSKDDKYSSVITRGEKEMIYGRKGQSMKKMLPFSVEVKSTLGAGDTTFKAGCIYGLLHGMSDDEIVRFASACSAIAISRFPLPLNPPTMEEVKKLLLN